LSPFLGGFFFPPSTIIFVVDLEGGGVESPNKSSPPTFVAFVAGPKFVTLFCLDFF
jgi:hypothetical protein